MSEVTKEEFKIAILKTLAKNQFIGRYLLRTSGRKILLDRRDILFVKHQVVLQINRVHDTNQFSYLFEDFDATKIEQYVELVDSDKLETAELPVMYVDFIVPYPRTLGLSMVPFGLRFKEADIDVPPDFQHDFHSKHITMDGESFDYRTALRELTDVKRLHLELKGDLSVYYRNNQNIEELLEKLDESIWFKLFSPEEQEMVKNTLKNKQNYFLNFIDALITVLDNRYIKERDEKRAGKRKG